MRCSDASGGRARPKRLGLPWWAMSELVRYRFSVEEYHLMADAGLFGEDDRVELLDGEVVEMAPIGSRHAACVKWLNAFFTARLGSRVVLGVQDPMGLSERSEPQPDLTLLRPRPDYYAAGHPTPADALMVVEVADTTVGSDRGVKMPLYAAGGVAEAWLVDLPAGEVHSFRRPAPAGYQDITPHGAGDVVAPLAFPEVGLAVTELFAALSV